VNLSITPGTVGGDGTTSVMTPPVAGPPDPVTGAVTWTWTHDDGDGGTTPMSITIPCIPPKTQVCDTTNGETRDLAPTDVVSLIPVAPLYRYPPVIGQGSLGTHVPVGGNVSPVLTTVQQFPLLPDDCYTVRTCLTPKAHAEINHDPSGVDDSLSVGVLIDVVVDGVVINRGHKGGRPGGAGDQGGTATRIYDDFEGFHYCFDQSPGDAPVRVGGQIRQTPRATAPVGAETLILNPFIGIEVTREIIL